MYQTGYRYPETHPAWLPTMAELSSVANVTVTDCADLADPRDAEVTAWIANADAAAAELAGELAIR